MNKIWIKLQERFNPESASAWIYDYTPNILTALLTFVIFWLLWKAMNRALEFAIKETSIDATLSGFFKGVLKYLVIGTGLFSALSELGVNTSSILASLGVVGMTIGFAAKDTLSNLISGIFIFWDRPFVVGDIVEIGSQYGKVSAVTLRSTRVVTPDGKMIAFPNSTVINSAVISYTNYPHLQITTEFTFPSSLDLEKVRKQFVNLIASNSLFMQQPIPEVNLKIADAQKAILKFSVWIEDETKHINLENILKETVFYGFKDQLKS